jgi:hypothetical protein
MSSYDRASYDAENRKVLSMDGAGAGVQTSVQAAASTLDRRTFQSAVTVKDFNLSFRIGETCTGTQDSARWRFGIGKSLAGTGAVVLIGSAVVGTTADVSVVDASVSGTNVNFAAGDDIVLQILAGTVLPADSLTLSRADVSYVNRFTA